MSSLTDLNIDFNKLAKIFGCELFEENGVTNLFTTMLDSLPIGVTITDTTSKIIYTNMMEACIHGYEVGELIGKNIRTFSPKELWHPVTVDRMLSFKRWQRESVNVRKDGTVFPVNLISSIIYDDDGKVMGVITCCEDLTNRKSSDEIQDLIDLSEARAKAAEVASKELANEVTERHKAEVTLKETHQTLQALIKASPLAIVVVSLEEKVKIWNPAAERMFGWSEKEVIGEKLPIFPDKTPDHHNSDGHHSWNKTFASASTMQIRLDNAMETQRRRRDGTPIDVSISVAPLLGANGHLNGTMAIIADITEHKRAEGQLKTSQQQLRDLSMRLQSLQEEERAKIAREIHDELGQSLTALKLDLSWINQRLLKEQDKLHQKIEKMSLLIDDTIQIVRRISTELRPTILDDLGLVAATDWAVREFQSRTETECNLIIEPEDISLNTACATTVFRILQEALTNVARHTTATKVDISLKKKQHNLFLKVKDNGRGITDAEILDAKSLGLIGIKERARIWNGEVYIKGVVGEGTTITVKIPIPK